MSFTTLELVHVALDLEGESFPVVRLALAQRQIWFEYHNDFIATGLEISPFFYHSKRGLPLEKAICLRGSLVFLTTPYPTGGDVCCSIDN